MAGHPSLRPASFGVTYGAPCATTRRTKALSLNPSDTPTSRSPTELYRRPPELPRNRYVASVRYRPSDVAALPIAFENRVGTPLGTGPEPRPCATVNGPSSRLSIFISKT